MVYKNNDTSEMYYGGALTRRLDNGVVFTGTPTPEMLAEWGFTTYTPPQPIVDAREQRMQEILTELANTDYLAIKAYEGEDMSEHPGWKEHRAALRVEYRELEAEINEITNAENIE